MHRFWLGREFRRLRRGMLKYLILHYLTKTSLHGYALIKRIEKDFKGLYAPSPGVIYPALQLLEDMGWISHREEEGKKVYFVTEKGKKVAAEREELIEKALECRYKGGAWVEISRTIFPSFKRIIRAIFLNREKLTSEKIEKIKSSINRTVKEIEEILSK